jgi:hypothetical protein
LRCGSFWLGSCCRDPSSEEGSEGKDDTDEISDREEAREGEEVAGKEREEEDEERHCLDQTDREDTAVEEPVELNVVMEAMSGQLENICDIELKAPNNGDDIELVESTGVVDVQIEDVEDKVDVPDNGGNKNLTETENTIPKKKNKKRRKHAKKKKPTGDPDDQEDGEDEEEASAEA